MSRHFALLGLGRTALESDALAIAAENDALDTEVAREVRVVRMLLSAPFVTSYETQRLSVWLARSEDVVRKFAAAVIDDLGSGRYEVNTDADNVATHAQALIRSFHTEGFDEIQRRATTRTAATGFAVIAAIGGTLWYVSKRKTKR